jgi:hypothetical protein
MIHRATRGDGRLPSRGVQNEVVGEGYELKDYSDEKITGQQ